MAGARNVSDTEIEMILKNLNLRDQVLVLMGIYTGFRISELLSIKVGDVLSLTSLKVHRRHLKGKTPSRQVPLHPNVIKPLERLLEALKRKPELYLFQSRKEDNKPITRISAYNILKAAYIRAGLEFPGGTHFMRKTFAHNIYRVLDKDLVATSKALGHSDIRTTIAYLKPHNNIINKAILSLK